MTCRLQPSQNSSARRPTGLVSYGEAIRAWPGGAVALGFLSRRLITSPACGDGPGVVLQQHPASMSTAGSSRSHGGEGGGVDRFQQRVPVAGAGDGQLPRLASDCGGRHDVIGVP